MAALGLGFPWDAGWICPRPAWRRACFFSAMLRFKAAFRPPNSSRDPDRAVKDGPLDPGDFFTGLGIGFGWADPIAEYRPDPV